VPRNNLKHLAFDTSSLAYVNKNKDSVYHNTQI